MVNVLAPAYSGSQNIRVEIFTIAFRKVRDETFFDIPSGKPIPIRLTDGRGTPLAEELYYVIVTVDGRHSIGKLLILG